MYRLILLVAITALSSAQTEALEGFIQDRKLVFRVPAHHLDTAVPAQLRIETNASREVSGTTAGDYVIYRVDLMNAASTLRLELTARTADGRDVTFAGTAVKGSEPASWTPAQVTLSRQPEFHELRTIRVKLLVSADRAGQVRILRTNADGSSAGPEQRMEVVKGENVVQIDAEAGQTITALNENGKPVAEAIVVPPASPVGESHSFFSPAFLASLLLAAAVITAGVLALFNRRMNEKVTATKASIDARIEHAVNSLLQQMQTHRKNLEESLASSRMPAVAAQDDGRRNLLEKIRQLERRMGEPFQRDIGPPRQQMIDAGPDARAVAVVNEWLRRGSRKLDDLKELAAKIDLQVTMCAHREVTRSISDLTYMKYHLTANASNPAWLLCPAADAGRYLAVPFLSQQFRSSNALEFLSRLYEIPDSVPSSALTISKVYRACLLEQAGQEVYKLSKKGLLQLEGQQAPDVAAPPDFSRLLPVPPTTAGAPESLSAGLHSAFDEIARLEREIGTHRDWSPPANPEVLRQIEALRFSVNSLRRDIQERASAETVLRMEESTARMRAELGHALQEVATVRAEIDATRNTAVAGEKVLSQSILHLEETRREQESVAQARSAAAATLQGNVDRSVEASPADLEAAVDRGPQRAPWSLPPEWREALSEASENRPFRDRPVDALLEALAPRLKETGLAGAVVQMSVAGDERFIRLAHDTSPDDRHVALAVARADDDDGRVAILLPPGPVPASSYFSLYKKLIPDIQNWTPPYQIRDVEDPAYLMLVQDGLYEVRSPMRCSQ